MAVGIVEHEPRSRTRPCLAAELPAPYGRAPEMKPVTIRPGDRIGVGPRFQVVAACAGALAGRTIRHRSPGEPLVLTCPH